MGAVQMVTDPGMKRRVVPEFLAAAEAADRPLKERTVLPKEMVRIVPAAESGCGRALAVHDAEIGELKEHVLGRGDRLCLDFGDHFVGYVALRVWAAGSHQDAPALLHLKFAEMPQELLDDSDAYDGWISRGWIQEEWLHLDVLPQEIRLPRRYAFRYLEIAVIDTSQKFRIAVEEARLTAVSAVDPADAAPIENLPPDLREIDRVCRKTLQDCMQQVFEDGPKRDRRLWLGDMMLEARVNYCTFRDVDLVKRCLYLFAGSTREDGKIAACLFTEPEICCDDTFLWDYSLFYITVLHDYYRATADEETLRTLWPSAYWQIELALNDMEDGVLREDPDRMTAFIDWKEGLERQAAAQGIFIYVLRQALALADLVGSPEQIERIRLLLTGALEKAKEVFWDAERECFVSGPNRQAAKITQAWMVLADIVTGEEARNLMLRTVDDNAMTGVLTPYAYHFMTEAMFHVGEKERALDMIRNYWGGMLRQGADTFWEAFDPENPSASPYGNAQVNSYCHAWSCTPAWLLREYCGDGVQGGQVTAAYRG